MLLIPAYLRIINTSDPCFAVDEEYLVCIDTIDCKPKRGRLGYVSLLEPSHGHTSGYSLILVRQELHRLYLNNHRDRKTSVKLVRPFKHKKVHFVVSPVGFRNSQTASDEFGRHASFARDPRKCICERMHATKSLWHTQLSIGHFLGHVKNKPAVAFVTLAQQAAKLA